MAEPDLLVVWLHDEPVAELTRAANNTPRLRYTPGALTRHEINRPLLSCSLLLGGGNLDAAAFVDGLLPEGNYRNYLAQRADVLASDSFALCAHYGRDIAGAVQFLAPHRHPVTDARWSVEELADDRLDELVDDLPNNPFALADDSELSIPGLQDKMLLVALPDRRWGRPHGGRPSTHILKRDSTRHRGVVRAELDALAVARHAGLTDIDTWLEHHAGYDCLIVERYDRVVLDAGTLRRVHQEDTCQALGRGPDRKYELRQAKGGPEFSEVAELLDLYATDPSSQLDRLAQIATYTAIIGNADAHGKNISLLHDPIGTIRLAPLYDTVPTVLWPSLVSTPAMSLGAAATFDGMNLAAVAREATSWRHDPTSASEAATACAIAMLDAVKQEVVDPTGTLAQRILDVAPRFIP
jgi:serine/threonine-protein kinase HipA